MSMILCWLVGVRPPFSFLNVAHRAWTLRAALFPCFGQSWRRARACQQPVALSGQVLIHTEVTKYLEFKAVDGSFVFSKGTIHKARALHA
jgi:GDP dissociation inhibitor